VVEAAKKDAPKGGRQKAKKDAEKKFTADLTERILLVDFCRDVANTTKHRDVRGSDLAQASLALEYSEADEFSPGGYGLRLSGQDKDHCTSFYNEAARLPEQWWDFLVQQKVVEDLDISERTPFWLRSRVGRAFGGGVLRQAEPDT